MAVRGRTGSSNFNPRSPYGERLVYLMITHDPKLFQSTLPLRGATPSIVICFTSLKNFNPRSPYGERHEELHPESQRQYNFNPRSPYGERLFENFAFVSGAGISIHAPLTGSDSRATTGTVSVGDFNPRSPYGERLSPAPTIALNRPFQSTLPLRGATFP